MGNKDDIWSTALQLHNEAYDGWKTYGFPSFALVNQRYLSRTLTCSNYLRTFLIDKGYPAHRIGVAKLGINISRFADVKDSTRVQIKNSVLGINSSTLVLSSSARLESQKRPLLVPDILADVNKRLEHLKRSKVSCEVDSAIMYMMGNGDLRDALREQIDAKGMSKQVILLGTVDDPSTILRGSDAFLLPSATEGISLAVAEAMAMGVPIITSFAGGLPEQLGDLGKGKAKGGLLIPLTGDIVKEISLYADGIMHLACSSVSRSELANAAKAHVSATFNQDTTLQAFPLELGIAKRTKSYFTKGKKAYPVRTNVWEVSTACPLSTHSYFPAESGGTLRTARHGIRRSHIRRSFRNTETAHSSGLPALPCHFSGNLDNPST